MGKVVNEKLAQNTPCKCMIYGDPKKAEDRLCFSEGVIGALSDSQEYELCTDILTLESSKEFAERINRFKVLGGILDKCLESETKDFLGCIEKEARELRERRGGKS